MSKARFATLLLSFYVIGLATSMSFMEIGSGLLFLFFFIQNSYKNLNRNTPFIRPLLLFVCIAVVGILLGPSTYREKLYDFGRMRFFLLFLVLVSAFKEEILKLSWIKVLRVTTSIIAVYGFIQHFIAIDLIRPEGKKVLLYALQDEKIGPLVVGTFNHHLTFSNIYLLFSCLFLSLGFSSPKKNKYDIFLGSFLFLLVFWSQSRVAWVAIPICISILSYHHFGKRAVFKTALFLGVLLVGLYLSNTSFQTRLAKTFDLNDHRSVLPRLTLWKAQIEMWKEHPLVGIGWNNNERHSKEYVDRLHHSSTDPFYGHAHSMPLQILATTGLLGLFSFLWLWGEIFKKLLLRIRASTNTRKALLIGILASLVGFWVQGLTQWNFGDAEVLHSIIFLWALSAVI